MSATAHAGNGSSRRRNNNGDDDDDSIESDAELERLKAKRLAEMQKNLSAQKQQQADAKSKTHDGSTKVTPRDVLVSSLGFRGMEVLQCAEAQYPREAPLVVGQLADIIRTEQITERIDGGQLLAVFRMLGLSVRIQTSIKVEKDGKLVSLSEKFKSKQSRSDDVDDNDNDKW